jgi:hypothetical protein
MGFGATIPMQPVHSLIILSVFFSRTSNQNGPSPLYSDWPGIGRRLAAAESRGVDFSERDIQRRVRAWLSKGWNVDRVRIRPIKGLRGGQLVWIQVGRQEDGEWGKQEVSDGARILLWRRAGASSSQILSTRAFESNYGYGDGFICGSDAMLGRWLILADMRRGMSPFAYGGIEIWRRSGAEWTYHYDYTTPTEISALPRYSNGGRAITFELRPEPHAIDVAHGGPRLDSQAIYTFADGLFNLRLRRKDSPLAALDELIEALRNGKLKQARSRCTLAVWRRRRWLTIAKWDTRDQPKNLSRAQIRLSWGSFGGDDRQPEFGLLADIRRLAGRYRVVRLRRTNVD